MIHELKKFLFWHQNPKQIIVKNIFWLSATGSSRVIRLVVIVAAARILGVEEYGLFSYVLSLLGIFALGTDIGTSELLTRDVAAHPSRRDIYFATNFWIKLLLVFLVSLCILIIAPHIARFPSARGLLYLAIFLMAFDAMRELILAYIRGLEKMELETIITMVMNLTMGVLAYIVLLRQPSAKNLLVAYIVSSGVALVASMMVAKSSIANIFKNFHRPVAIEILHNCWPLGASIAFGAMLSLDVVMLSWWRPQTDIGLYAAGQRIVQVLSIFPVLLATAIFPRLSSSIQENNIEQEKKINEKTLAMIFLFTLPAIVIGIILSQPIFRLVYGQPYLPGVGAFRILLLGAILIFPGAILSNIIVAHNRQRRVLKYMIAASMTNILLNILFIRALGIVGAAVATLIAQGVYYGCMWREIKKFTTFTMPLKKILVGTSIVGVLCFILNKIGLNVIMNLIVSAVAYISLLYIVKETMLSDSIRFIQTERNNDMQTITAIENEY